MKDMSGTIGSGTECCCHVGKIKNPYQHGGRAVKDSYRHDRRADSHCHILPVFASPVQLLQVEYEGCAVRSCISSSSYCCIPARNG